MSINGLAESWAPAACTLPTEERPLRVAEFDALFAASLREVERVAPDRLRLVLDAGAEAEARELVGRESACCSFFSFRFEDAAHEQLVVEVAVPTVHVGVLDALATRAKEGRTR